VFGSPSRSVSHVDFESEVAPSYRTRLPLKDGALDLKTRPFGAEKDTVHAVLQHAFEAYAALPCFGTREFIRMHSGEGDKFPRKVGTVVRAAMLTPTPTSKLLVQTMRNDAS